MQYVLVLIMIAAFIYAITMTLYELIKAFWEPIASFLIVSAYVLGVCLVAFTVIKWMKHARQKSEMENNERKRAREREEERIAERQASQQRCHAELVNITENALQNFESLTQNLMYAEALLDQAERDFKEQAFNPFWDSVEQATLRLGVFADGVAQINQALKKYGDLSSVYKAKAPEFPIAVDSVQGMAAGNTTANRMSAIVRQAQRDFHFASIYTQRRTNQILIAGFTNLGQALDGMGQRISQSIDELSTQVSEMSLSLSDSMTFLGKQMTMANESTVAISESMREIQSSLERDASERSERHARALEMLDNIQRGRKPIDIPLKEFLTKSAT